MLKSKQLFMRGGEKVTRQRKEEIYEGIQKIKSDMQSGDGNITLWRLISIIEELLRNVPDEEPLNCGVDDTPTTE